MTDSEIKVGVRIRVIKDDAYNFGRTGLVEDFSSELNMWKIVYDHEPQSQIATYWHEEFLELEKPIPNPLTDWIKA